MSAPHAVRRAVLAAVVLCGSASASEPRPGGSLVVQAVGDLMLAGSAEPVLRSDGYDRAFDGTRAVLAEADLNLANLETSVTLGGTPAAKEYVFRQHPESLPAVWRAGIRLVALANNHTGDYGELGLLDTLKHLEAAGIAFAGAGRDVEAARRPALVEVGGRRVAMLSYSLTFPTEFHATPRRAGTPFGHEAWVRADVKRWRPQVDVVLVCFHWGAERTATPKDYQRLLGRAAVEAGADAVFGTHPHVLQGIELVQGRPVFYSLGNYAFGSYSPAAEGVIARVRFDAANRIEAVSVRPLVVRNDEVAFNPQLAEGERARAAARQIEELSRPFGTVVSYQDGWVSVVLPGR